MSVTMKIKGIDSLLSKLQTISNPELETVVGIAAKMVQGQAKELCPATNGELKTSIHTEVKKKGKTVIGRVYTNKDYAAYVEFGTGRVGNGTYPYDVEGLTLSYRNTPWVYPVEGEEGTEFVTTSGMPARPFMYPALAENRDKVSRMIAEGYKKELEKTAKGGK